MRYGTHHRDRGATLVLVLVILALGTLLASRQMLQSTVTRLASAGTSFRTESQWIAEGVATQWAARSAEVTTSTEMLLAPAQWSIDRYQIDIRPSSANDKLLVSAVPVEHWLPFWQRQQSEVSLVDDPQRTLTERGPSSLEVLLSPKHLSAQDAYASADQSMVPAALLTVWGSGKVDLNHCPADVLAVRLHGFTDAQISGILRLRAQLPITKLDSLPGELSLSEQQQTLLTEAATLRPEHVELIITIRKGVLTSMYHAVVQTGTAPQVLEVRSVE